MAAHCTQPYNVSKLITKSDTINFDGSTTSTVNAGTVNKADPCDAIYVGGAGIVVAVLENSATAAHTCIAGQILPIKAIRVNSTTTTATLMQALYYV